MYGHYHKGMPLKPRTLLYPIFLGELQKSLFGAMIDAFAIIAVAAGELALKQGILQEKDKTAFLF